MCENLKTVKFGDGLETLGTDEKAQFKYDDYGVFTNSALESIQFPSTLKRIKDAAFKNCKNLYSVQFPNGLEEIGKDCFHSSGLCELICPPNLKEIDESAFACCKYMQSV